MNNTDKVLSLLKRISPKAVTNAEIVSRTSIQPHQQVFQITSRLSKQGAIASRKHGHEWVFWCRDSEEANLEYDVSDKTAKPTSIGNYWEFEKSAKNRMEQYFSCDLTERQLELHPKRWDFVSKNSEIVGDAKFYTLVKGTRFPPAKMSVIAEHVWLLEKTKAKTKFLIFGNERRVPEIWLEKYGQFVVDVDFYFLAEDGKLDKLN